MKQRQVSEEMLNAFLSGELSSLLEAVKKDDTLDLELRGDSVNIYYRGGSLFKITGINNVFSVSFDTNYCTEGSVNLNSTRRDIISPSRSLCRLKELSADSFGVRTATSM
ncbi:hypothetical protein [Pseudoflavonifractor phocaeensis]|uniref:hypothetical protein n=1 Tax=Pseudoflavonifractor phocaeensis TaxID=1870988 RepID=UPI001F1CE087|nr:hypothetical protein [Pseudoflavonifractor phocaeensis]MCF2596209.1 hypothetical protein [Pseudoflavonifractor phocaeensis]